MYRAKALRGVVLALSVLYKTLCGYCTSTSSQVRVTDFKSEMRGIYTKSPLFVSLCSPCEQNLFRNLCSQCEQ